MLCIARGAAKAGCWENRAHVDAASPVPFRLLAHVRTAIFAYVDPLPRQVAAERAVLLCDDEGLADLGGFSARLVYEGTGQQLCGHLARRMPTVDVHCVRCSRLFSSHGPFCKMPRKGDANLEFFRGCRILHGGWRKVATFRRDSAGGF
jgi:hypothetical protein